MVKSAATQTLTPTIRGSVQVYSVEYLQSYLRHYCISIGFDTFVSPLRKGNSVQFVGKPIISATNCGFSNWEFSPGSEFDEDNPDDMPEQLSIWDLAVGDEFEIIASTEFD